MKNVLLIICIAAFSFSCAAVKKRPADEFKNYQEDLTETRYTFPSLPDPEKLTKKKAVADGVGNPVDAELEEAINYYVRSNMNEEYYSGFTILVYSGVDRDQAFETRNSIYNTFSDIKTHMEYQQPRYLVKVGKYINRIEAQYNYHKLKEKFPTARIIQDRFQRESTNGDEEINNDEE